MKIAICDDENAIVSQVEATLLKYAEQMAIKMDIEVYYNGEELLASLESGYEFFLVYLDIEMGRVNGLEIGKYIRQKQKNYRTEIVYISGTNTYDRQLFDVQPLHFIPKPIDNQIIIDDLKIALERSGHVARCYTYMKNGESKKIPIHSIYYFESLNREVRVVYEGGEDQFYGKLESVLAELLEFHFIRIHRSYIINMSAAIAFKYDEVEMPGGVLLSISRSKRAEVRNIQLEQEWGSMHE